MRVLMAALAAFAMLAAPPALAQRLVSPFEIEPLVAPIAHHPGYAIQDAIAAHPDHQHHHLPPPHPNGPPSPAAQMQQGHKPSAAVQMQRRVPESQRQPIVQQHYRSWDAGAHRPPPERRRAP